MSRHLLLLLALSSALPLSASAQRVVAVADQAKLQEICQLPATQIIRELYFTKIVGASFSSYNKIKGTLPLVLSEPSGLSGALQIKAANTTLEAALSEDIAQSIVALSQQGKTEVYAAFRLDPNKPCTKEADKLSATGELALLEISKISNGRPLLRFETAAYSQWKKEDSLSVVLTPPTVLSGEGTIGKISDTLPKNKPSLQRCYAKGLATNPRAQGTLTARISLDQDGAPEDVIITIDTLGDKSVQSCVVESLRKNTYAAPNTSFSFTMYLLHQ